MEPQCHPEKSQARSETDLQAEQDEFFLSGSVACVKLVGDDNEFRNEFRNKIPSVTVLDEIFERPSDSIVKPPHPPTFKVPLKPTKIIKTPAKVAIEESVEDISVTLNKISHENEVKLAEMSVEEIDEMKRELFESVPESFLKKLLDKNSKI